MASNFDPKELDSLVGDSPSPQPTQQPSATGSKFDPSSLDEMLKESPLKQAATATTPDDKSGIDYEGLENTHPKTAQHFSTHPDQIKTLQEDPQSYKDHEDELKKAGALEHGYYALQGSLDRFMANVPVGLGMVAEKLPQFLTGTPGKDFQDYASFIDKNITKNSVSQRLNDIAETEEKMANPNAMEYIKGLKSGNYADIAEKAYSDLVGQVPTILSFAALGPVGASLTLSTETAGKSREEAVKSGVEEEKAKNIGLIKGAISVPLNLLMASRVVGNWQKLFTDEIGPVGFKKFMQHFAIHAVKNTLIGGSQGAVQQIANNAVDKHFVDPNKGYFDGVPESTFSGMVQGAALSLAAAPEAIGKLRTESAVDAYKRLGALAKQNKAIGAAVSATTGVKPKTSGYEGGVIAGAPVGKTGENLPTSMSAGDPVEHYKDFIRTLTHDSPYKDVRISKQNWDEYMESVGKDPVEMAGQFGLHYPQHGEEFKVPLHRWLSTIGLTEHHQGMSDFIRMTADQNTRKTHVDNMETKSIVKDEEELSPRMKELFHKSFLKTQDILKSNKEEHPEFYKFLKGKTTTIRGVEDERNKTGLGQDERSGQNAKPQGNGGQNNQEQFQGSLNRNEGQPFFPGKQSEIGEHAGQVLEQAGVPAGPLLEVVNKSNEGLFKDPRLFGFTDKQELAYVEKIKDAHDAAVEKIVGDIEKKKQREQSREYKNKLAEVKEELAKDFDKRRDVMAHSMLVDHQMPDGSKLPKEYESLPKIKIADMFGEGRSEQSLGTMVDALANHLGYDSADQMYREMATSPDRESYLDEAAKAQLNEGEPEFSDQMRLAIENEKANQIAYAELKHMASEEFAATAGLAKGLIRPPKQIESYNRSAEEMVRNNSVSDIDVKKYLRAVDAARAEASRLFGKGDIAGAFKAKEDEAVQRFALKHALDAKEFIDKGLNFNKKISKASYREKTAEAGGDHLAQQDSLRRRFNLPGVKNTQPKGTLPEWVENHNNAERPILFDKDIMNEGVSMPYKDMPFGMFEGLVNALKTIDHIASSQGKLIKKGEIVSAENTADALKAQTESWKDTTPTSENQAAKTNWENAKHVAKELGSTLMRMPWFWSWMDGHARLGEWYNNWEKTQTEATIRENNYLDTHDKGMNSFFSEYSAKEMKEFINKRIDIPEAKNKNHDGQFTKDNIVQALAYCGTEKGTEGVLNSYGWDKSVLPKLWEKLSSKDVEVVKAMWGHPEFYKKEAYDMNERMTGVRPSEVKGDPFTIKDGEGKTHNLKGGYTPHRFADDIIKKMDKDETAQQMAGQSFGNAKTYQGWALDRTTTNSRKMDLSIRSWDRAIRKQIHDTTHREMVYNFRTMFQHPDIKQSIKSVAGEEGLDAVDSWINRLAAGGDVGSYDPWGSWLSRKASGVNVVFVGFNPMSWVAHATNYFAPLKAVGFKYFAKANVEIGSEYIQNAAKFIGKNLFKMKDQMDMVDKLDGDEFLKQRSTAGFAEFREMMSSYDFIKNQSGKQKLSTSLSMLGIRLVDDLRARIAYHAAYNKVMDGGIPESNIKAGDHESAVNFARDAVKKYVGSGQLGDIAQIQAKGGFNKFLTFFYSPFSTMYNQWAASTHEVAHTKNYADYAVKMGLYLGVPAYLLSLAHGEEPSGDDGWGEWAKWMLKTPLEFLAEGVPVAREFVKPMVEAATEGKFEAPRTVIGSIGESLVKSAKILNHPFEPTEDEIGAALDVIGTWNKWPTHEMWKGFKAFMHWYND